MPLLDNPSPHGVGEVYECVSQHLDSLDECSFDVEEGRKISGEVTQRKAVEALGLTEVIDLNPYLCPGTRCPAVLGEVLVYRQGTHLTKTIVETASGRLAEQLVPIVEGLDR